MNKLLFLLDHYDKDVRSNITGRFKNFLKFSTFDWSLENIAIAIAQNEPKNFQILRIGQARVRANFWVQEVSQINEATLGICVSIFFRLVSL